VFLLAVDEASIVMRHENDITENKIMNKLKGVVEVEANGFLISGMIMSTNAKSECNLEDSNYYNRVDLTVIDSEVDDTDL
jgi:hypothetical protein